MSARIVLPAGGDLERDGWAFRDRQDAARRLARVCTDLHLDGPIVLGIPRGGMVVAVGVAAELRTPVDVIMMRRPLVPAEPNVAMGVIAEDGARVIDRDVVRRWAVRPEEIAVAERRERSVLRTRADRLRSGRPPADLSGAATLIIDDGVATGRTARAAVAAARARGAARVVVAAPVASAAGVHALGEPDDVACLITPPHFRGVATYYRHFPTVSDAEVAELLGQANVPFIGPR